MSVERKCWQIHYWWLYTYDKLEIVSEVILTSEDCKPARSDREEFSN